MNTNKPTCVLYAALDTFSGYGQRGRDIAKALIELKGEEWDIKILSCRWGATPNGFIEAHPEWEFLNKYIQSNHQLTSQPDYMFWNTIPSEGQVVGKWNCLITAGIESTIAPAEWVEGCQRMDLVLGSSKHTIDVLRNSKFEKRDQNSNQVVGVIEWTKPGDTLFEGIDEVTYKPQTASKFNLDNVTEDFCFLFNSMWVGNSPIGEDRKNIGLLIKSFFETFKNKTNKPALILKTTTVGSSYSDRDEILKRIKQIQSTVKSTNLPNIYLLHGDVTDEEINELNNHPKVKAMISFAKGEGYGRPLAEFCLSKKPVIASGWSGQVDFLDGEFAVLIPGTLTPTHPSAQSQGLILPGALWYSVDESLASKALEEVYAHYKKYEERGKRQGHKIKTEFSYDNMVLFLKNYLDKFVRIPKQVEFKLPQLTKIS